MSDLVLNQMSSRVAQQTYIPPLFPQEGKGNVLRIGVIGYGYWGPNIVRNLSGLETCELAAVCDKNPAALKRVTRALVASDA